MSTLVVSKLFYNNIEYFNFQIANKSNLTLFS